MRVPLPTDFVARLSSASKDARMVNSLKETKVDGVQVKKRPGLTSTGYNYSSIQGVLGLGGFLYLVYDDKFELSAYTGTPLPPYIYIGDLVGGYYAMIDNPPTSPGPGDAYWSASAHLHACQIGSPVWFAGFAESGRCSFTTVSPREAGSA